MRNRAVPPGQQKLPLHVDIDEAVRHLPGIKPGTRKTLAVIISLLNEDNSVTADQRVIAQRAECTDRSVRTHLYDLKQAGYLTVENDHRDKAMRFSAAKIQLTDKLSTILGLDTPETSH